MEDNNSVNIQYGVVPMNFDKPAEIDSLEHVISWTDKLENHLEYIQMMTERSAASILILKKKGDNQKELYMVYPFSFVTELKEAQMLEQIERISAILKEKKSNKFGCFSIEQKQRLLEIPFQLTEQNLNSKKRKQK